MVHVPYMGSPSSMAATSASTSCGSTAARSIGDGGRQDTGYWILASDGARGSSGSHCGSLTLRGRGAGDFCAARIIAGGAVHRPAVVPHDEVVGLPLRASAARDANRQY